MSPNNQHSPEISLKQLLTGVNVWIRYFVSNWLVVASVSLVGGILGITYAVLKKPEYVAITTFVLESGDNNSGGLGQYAGIASMVGIDLGGGGGGIFQGDNILELYKSRAMIRKALLSRNLAYSKALLIEEYIKINHLDDEWKDMVVMKALRFEADTSILPSPTFHANNQSSLTRLRDSVINKVVEDINDKYLIVNKLDKKLNIIKVQVTATNEGFAKAFNENLVQQVNNFYVQTKTKKSLKNVKILEQKTDSVRMVMNGAIYSAVSVNDATPNLNPTRQVQRMAPSQRAQFSAETNKMVLGELVKNLEITKMNLLREMPLIQVVDEPVLPLHKVKLGVAKSFTIGFVLFMVICVLYLLVKRVLVEVSDSGVNDAQ